MASFAHSRLVSLEPSATRQFVSGVSLHAHTSTSRERLSFFPAWVSGIPFVSGAFRRALERYRRDHGVGIDFDQAYWRPPCRPQAVLESERRRVVDRLDLQPLVAITDHDTIDAPAALNAMGMPGAGPYSLEWTVPFRNACFHLGIYNLPVESARPIMAELRSFAAQPVERRLDELLEWLHACRGTLVVLNHPFWDGEGLGPRQSGQLRQFLDRCRGWLDAFEINGYRPWRENRAVLDLAEAWRIPTVGGGDRHGHAPNALLNLTLARTFDEFSACVRDGRLVPIVVMPEYREPQAMRTLDVVRDVLSEEEEPLALAGLHRWTDRVFYTTDRDGERPLSFHFPDGVPLWILLSVWTACALGSPRVRPAVRYVFAADEGSAL